jgi:predicted porin
MKKSAILASAVAAAMLSGAAYADATAYGKVRLVWELSSESLAGVETAGVTNSSSRFGFKGSEDLGNGMSAVYQYEAQTNETQGAGVGTRLLYGGLKGDFGQVAIGSQWTPSYLLVRGNHDPFQSVGCNLCGNRQLAGFRADNALSYVNSFGDVTFAAALVSNEGTDQVHDALDVAVSVPVGPVTIGVSLQSVEDELATAAAFNNDDDRTAVDVGYSAGAFSVNLGLMQNDLDDDFTVITAGFDMGSGKITAQVEDDGTDNQSSLGYVHSLSKKTSLFAEATSGDLGSDETNVGIHINF